MHGSCQFWRIRVLFSGFLQKGAIAALATGGQAWGQRELKFSMRLGAGIDA
jgi:hypothetical protein